MEFFNHRLPDIENPQNRIFPSNFPQTSLRRSDEFQLPHPRFQKSDDGIQNFFRGRQEFQPISRISHPCARWNLWIPDFLSSSSPGIPTFLGRIPKFLSNRRLEFEFLRLTFLKTIYLDFGFPSSFQQTGETGRKEWRICQECQLLMNIVLARLLIMASDQNNKFWKLTKSNFIYYFFVETWCRSADTLFFLAC